MTKLWKNGCSLVLSVAILLSMAAVNVAAAEPPIGSVEQALGSVLVDGIFENGTAGWSTTPGATLSRSITETYNGSAGSGFVTQATADDYIYQNISLRKFSWYRYNVAVKLVSGSASVALKIDYGTDSWNTIAETKTLKTGTVYSNGWTVLSGYFLKTNTVAQTGTNPTDYFQGAKVYLTVDGDNVSYYLDDFIICRMEGFYNDDFLDGTNGWNEYKHRADTTLVVRDGDSGDTWEAGKKVMRVTLSTESAANHIIGQPISLEKGVLYEFTARIKVVSGFTTGDYARLRLVSNNSTYGNLPALGPTIATSYLNATRLINNEWTALKGTYIYNGSNPYIYIYPALMVGDGSNIGRGNRTYDLMDFKVKKSTNIMSTPYFTGHSVNTSNTAVEDYINQTNWLYAAGLSIESTRGADASNTAYTPEAKSPNMDSIGTYDNSNSRGKLVLADDNSTWLNSSVYQNNRVFEKGRKYNISVAVKRGGTADDENTEHRKGRFYAQHYKSPSGTDNEVLNNMGFVEITKDWQVFKLPNYEFALPETYTDRSIIAFRTDYDSYNTDTKTYAAENLYFDDFSVEPVYEAPVVSDVGIGGDVVTSLELPLPSIRISATPDKYSYRYRYLLYDNAAAATGIPVLAGHTAIGGTIPAVTAQGNWGGKYISLEITPISEYGLWGNTIESAKTEVEEGYSITSASGSGFTGTVSNGATIAADVTVKNNMIVAVPVVVIIAYYENDSLSRIDLQEITVKKGTPEIFTPSVTLPPAVNNGSVKVYVWKGYDGTEFLMQPLTPAFPR